MNSCSAELKPSAGLRLRLKGSFWRWSHKMPLEYHGRLISRLSRAGILSKLVLALDSKTLMTVLRHFVSFRVCVPRAVVERVLFEVFGSQWHGFYAAYTYYHATYILPVSHTTTSGTRGSGSGGKVVRDVIGVWGANVRLEFPMNHRELDGYAALMALETLCPIEHRCSAELLSTLPLTEPLRDHI
jgi:hypothetical protein